ncbi:MAG TPA: M15 family metallopeptidase [Acidimicrobiales bacterium]|nr:M15 family metallopeptidase [Acidimicrobiales bacterium]
MWSPLPLRNTAVGVALTLLATACGGGDDAAPERVADTTTPAPTTTEARPAAETDSEALEETTQPVDPAFARPAWLGTRELPLRPDGLGEIQPTPPELDPRALATPSELPPPADDRYASSVSVVAPDVVARSTYNDTCPVGLDELRYLNVSHWGFDGLHHTGELLVHADHADDVVEVFRRVHEARFPIEEMRITEAHELDAHPTGDGNNTGAFVCRVSRAADPTWSEHAYGRAVDINPFHNPYVRDDMVIPELASTYVDRADDRPGMIQAGGPVVEAFAAVGWSWGGDWRSSKDYMHFSVSGR